MYIRKDQLLLPTCGGILLPHALGRGEGPRLVVVVLVDDEHLAPAQHGQLVRLEEQRAAPVVPLLTARVDVLHELNHVRPAMLPPVGVSETLDL